VSDGRPALQLRVGVFILVALGVFIVLIYLFGTQAGLFERHYRLVAEFSNIGGLLEGATVRLAGVPVGRVSEIRLPETGAGRVQLELAVSQRVRDRIRQDSVARIETRGLLGDKLIEISLGSPETRPLQEGERVQTEEPPDPQQLLAQGAALLQNLHGAAEQLGQALGTFAESGAIEEVAGAARSLRALATEVERGQGLLHRLIYDEQGGRLLTAGEAFLREAQTAASRLGRIAREIEEGKGPLHALIYGEGAALARLDQLLATTQRLLARVERGEGTLGLLLQSEEAARSVRRFLAAAEVLASTVERAQASDGLLKALLFDPEGKRLLTDLRTTARNFREVSDRLVGGQGLLGGLLAPGGEGTARELAQGIGRLGRLAEGLEGEEGLQEALSDFRIAMGNLRRLTERVEAGEGTLGGLIQDPTIYENLAAFLEGAQRSWLLRGVIRSAITAGEAGEGR